MSSLSSRLQVEFCGLLKRDDKTFLHLKPSSASLRLTKNIGLLMMQFCYYCAEVLLNLRWSNIRSSMTTEIQANDNHPLGEQITRDYKILRLLGKGGMGDVYLAEQLRVGRRRVALKVLNDSFATNLDMARRFENEASSAGRINHRNVVTVYESRITDEGQMYVAMEFVEGKSLSEFLREQGDLPLDKVVDITKQMCAGLAAAHKLGIIHRDIKPDNIMLAEEDGSQVVKLLDFGIARLSETDPSIGQTRAGVIMGTPTYMSPEQAMGKTGDKIDARSDIYALGIVIHQMLTGHVVFKASSPLEIIRKHISEQPQSLKHWRPDLTIPEAVEEVVLKALQKNRELRQQTVTELAVELEAAASGISPSASVSQKDMPTVRISKDAPEVATAPLSSEKTSVGPMSADRLSPQGRRLTNPGQQQTASDNQEPTQPNFRRETSQRPKIPPKPVPQPVQQAPQPPAPQPIISSNEAQQNLQQNDRQERSDESITSQKPRSHKKELLIASAVLLAIFATVFVVLQMRSGSAVTTISPVLEYRLKPDTPVNDLETLSLENSIRMGEGFAFEVRLITEGTFYVFAEPDGGGPLLWLMSSKTMNIGGWLRAPYGNSIKADKPTGVKTYLLVFVPKDLNWPPAQTLASALTSENSATKITPKNFIAEVPQEIASQIQESLKRGALELNASGSQQGKAVSFSLRGDAQQVSFYRVRVSQQP
jgi:eukaryotic-like serine/threonine-protein kinase